jgi:phage FluMu protein Com
MARKAKRHVRLRVIPQPEVGTRTVLVWEGPMPGPVIQGEGDVVMECGKCRKVLVEGMPVGNLRSIVLRCPNCQAYNETLAQSSASNVFRTSNTVSRISGSASPTGTP